MADGTSAWLSDAQLDYAMTIAVAPKSPLPDQNDIRVGRTLFFGDHAYDVVTMTFASYLGTEGEMPFTTVGRESCLFADLHNDAGRLATIDYADSPPTLYLGEYCTFDDLQFKQLVQFEGW